MKPQTFVINLERRADRRDAFFRNNPHMRHIEIFKAIDGYALSRTDLVADGIIAVENRYVEPALGVLMSHLTLWRHAVSSNRPVTVLEDDVILHHRFDSLTQRLMEQQKQFDFIAWGVNTDWPIRMIPGAGMPEATLLFDRQISSHQMDIETPPESLHLLRLSGFSGLCAYTVTPQAAGMLLRDLLPIGNQPASVRYLQAGLGLESHPVIWSNSGLDVELNRHTQRMTFLLGFPFLATPLNDWANSSFTRNAHSISNNVFV
ncbi:glycosyltransferase family 25 protein [Acetobacter sp.]|jgi:hypothetical protein|uniref:glycosyltransferase family 25 protein n=1 Tax=Acetobacter sp. TaxID=440 RepID=UPI0025C23761|nr:glycosyltransferase family 25 protein [Acetobacter sp.]MCH4092678.1 glycosyltransferase family 25 protein [Acetobacter sp.]MCI1301220.1 glycosyltransferase family 25 protein [Acetobacter sp.]MCI1317481.1 glycosyltransferase family 25 protein [Acetobacter sp.]